MLSIKLKNCHPELDSGAIHLGIIALNCFLERGWNKFSM